ncbi:anthrone oxygenase family protein [Nocardia asteroides]|uniref:anthrone oxygenase family protein n=1 Tax=Nocardia asteroides TaxID=1824 RepID=UPI003436EF27
MHTLSILALATAVASTGLVAGIVLAYSNSVMPGLRRADDRTFVDACQRLNTAIHNPLFMLVSNLALLSTAAATVLAVLADLSPVVLVWTCAALFLYLATLAITLAVNVPMNNRLIAAGHPDTVPDRLPGLRADFETRWTTMNNLRTALTTAALICQLIALILAR